MATSRPRQEKTKKLAKKNKYKEILPKNSDLCLLYMLLNHFLHRIWNMFRCENSEKAVIAEGSLFMRCQVPSKLPKFLPFIGKVICFYPCPVFSRARVLMECKIILDGYHPTRTFRRKTKAERFTNRLQSWLFRNRKDLQGPGKNWLQQVGILRWKSVPGIGNIVFGKWLLIWSRFKRWAFFSDSLLHLKLH